MNDHVSIQVHHSNSNLTTTFPPNAFLFTLANSRYYLYIRNHINNHLSIQNFNIDYSQSIINLNNSCLNSDFSLVIESLFTVISFNDWMPGDEYEEMEKIYSSLINKYPAILNEFYNLIIYSLNQPLPEETLHFFSDTYPIFV
jgi:hypothetical protein